MSLGNSPLRVSGILKILLRCTSGQPLDVPQRNSPVWIFSLFFDPRSHSHFPSVEQANTELAVEREVGALKIVSS